VVVRATTNSLSLRGGPAGALAMRASRPAARSAVALLQLFLRAPDAALARFSCLASFTQQRNSSQTTGVMLFDASSASAWASSASLRVRGQRVDDPAAIVAREQGLPAVLAVPGATTALPDGALVTVDGSRGRVAPTAG